MSKNNRGEMTLGQHLDKLLDVIGNAKEVKNLMKRVPPLEVKNRAMEKIVKDMQKMLLDKAVKEEGVDVNRDDLEEKKNEKLEKNVGNYLCL